MPVATVLVEAQKKTVFEKAGIKTTATVTVRGEGKNRYLQLG